jgi:YesN/AraC family two-component response regulator
MTGKQLWVEKKILVIESEPESQYLFLKNLEKEGFNISIAENGLVGLQRAQEELPDLVISEISTPKLDGYSVLTALRQNLVTAIIPLIFVTTNLTWSDFRKAMELGADDYLTKPCTAEELQRAIAACFHKRNTIKKWYAQQPQSFTDLPVTDTRKMVDLESIFLSDPLLSEVFNFIEANYQRQITLSDVALAVGYSSTYLTNLVRRQTGQTVQNWIIERRMSAARTLLLKTDETIEVIATKVGYQSMTHFFRQFRQHHRTSPQAWRKKQLAGENTKTKELLLMSKDK